MNKSTLVVRFGALIAKSTLAAVAFVAVGCGGDGVGKLPDGGGIHDASNGSEVPPSPAVLTVAPLVFDFGSVTATTTSTAQVFTVTNTGADVSGSISATVLGAAAGNFVISGNTCTTLAPAATCTVSVTFGPDSGGPKAANLSITANPGGAAMSTLDGSGVTIGGLTINPSSNGFGSVVVGAHSNATTFTVKNTSGAASGAITVQPAGANPADFIEMDTCNTQTLPANGTCTLTVTFQPGAAGQKAASFNVSSNPGGSVAASVTGTALAPANLVIAPLTHDFGSIVTGQTSGTTTINVANIGGVATGVLTQSLTGGAAAEFNVISSTCDGATLNPNASCVVIVTFSPSSVGAKTAAFSVDDAGSSVTSGLSGTGILAGQLQISQANSFGNVNVGSVSTSQTLTVTNTGGSATGALVTGISGPSASQFRIGTNGCAGAVLAGGGQCQLDVVFAPTAGGADTATLTVSGVPGGSAAAALAGNGIPGAHLTISPTSQGYGTVGIGAQSAFQSFTITNAGGTPTGTPTTALAGANADQYELVNGCTAVLAPLGSCIVMVRFKPTTLGNLVATFTVSASPGGSVLASLFGQGANGAQITVLPGSLAFPLTNIGDTAITQSFSVTNLGASTTGTLAITETGAAAGDYTITSNCTTLAPNASCTATVSFAPTAVGNRNATATVTGTPGGSASVALSGTAQPNLEIIFLDSENGGVSPLVNPFDFGTDVVNGFGDELFIELRNNTSQDHVLTELATGFGADYVFDGLSCGGGKFALVPGGAIIGGNGGTCSAFVFFNPTTTGVKPASATFAIGAGVVNQAVQGLTGTGIDSLTITAETTSDFGNVATGTTSPVLRFDVKNAQGAPTTGPLAVHLTGTLFSFSGAPVSGGCTGVQLAGGQTCTISLVFKPIQNLAANATLSVTGTPGGAPSIDVTGIGVDPTHLIYNPDPIHFGNVFDGDTRDVSILVLNPAGAQTSGPISFSISNDSCQQITLHHPGGPPNPCYSLLPFTAGDCISGTTSLAAGETCNLRVHFSPGTTIDFITGSLDVTASPGNSPALHKIPLDGNGLSTITIDPTFFDFGNLEPFNDIFDANFTVTNISDLDQPNFAFQFFGTSDDLFVFSGCDQGLPAGASCQLTVEYAPESRGEFDDAFLDVFTDNGFAQAEITGTSSGSGSE